MKKLIGLLVVVLAIIALLLTTCDGPSSDPSASSGPSTSVETPAAPAAPPAAASDAAASDAAAADKAASAPDASETPGAPSPNDDAATAPTPASPPSSTPASPPHSPRLSVPSITLSALPVEVLPESGLEALLAVHSRDLEGGSGESSALLLVSADSLRAQFRIELPDREWLPTDFTRGQPASTINTPTAYGQRWGQVFAGAAYQNRIRYDDWTDGVASAGLGLGNPMRYVGLDVTVNILDTYTEFAEDRSLSLKLHRRLPYRTAVAVGHENIWHTAGTDGGSSRYLVVSKVMLLRDRPTSSFGSMVLNLGLGNDRFLPETDFVRGEDGVNAFGSLAVRLLPPVNAIANWTGQDLALGLSIAPVRTWPLVVTPALVDVTGTAGDGARFSMSAGLSYTFR
jgi:hypothetical protein